jgi:GTP-binding protein HflX
LSTRPAVEKAGLVGCYFSTRGRIAAEESLLELEALAQAAGALVLDRALQWRAAPDPAFFIGKGKAEELRLRVEALELDLLVFDDELSAGQQRNLENKTGCKILDRTQLILDIFSRRARTREGKLQVELAQLNYLLPRLAGKGTMLSRLGAGIGTRGPGETKLEMDRRRIRSRIALLSRELDRIRIQRELQRTKRQGIPLPVVSLVGYTNAGKSTLFNALTQAGAWESSQLFATLDPLLRKLRLPNRLEIVLSDTVGFIRKLPHGLVAAFRATLEEVRAADLLLHVVDISNHGWREQMAAVEDVLLQLGVQNTPTIQVFNKIDLLDSPSPGDGAAADPGRQRPVMVAARLGTGIPELVGCIATMLDSFMVQAQWKIPYLKADLISRLRGAGQVLSETYEEDGILLLAVMPRSTARFVEECLADRGTHRRDTGQEAEQDGSV